VLLVGRRAFWERVGGLVVVLFFACCRRFGLGVGLVVLWLDLFSVGWGRFAGWLGLGVVVYCLSIVFSPLCVKWVWACCCSCVRVFILMCCAFSWCFWAIRRPSVFVRLSAVSPRVAVRMPLPSLSRIRCTNGWTNRRPFVLYRCSGVVDISVAVVQTYKNGYVLMLIG
jgi:hypothetical protein